jgi:hypothetical protein
MDDYDQSILIGGLTTVTGFIGTALGLSLNEPRITPAVVTCGVICAGGGALCSLAAVVLKLADALGVTKKRKTLVCGKKEQDNTLAK